VNHQQTKRRAEYDAYLASEQWQQLRAKALERDGHACRVCNSPTNLHVHHRTYLRFGNELVDDLTVLCKRCHKLFHGPTKSGKPRQMTRYVDSHERDQVLELLENDRSYFTTQEVASMTGLTTQRAGSVLASLRRSHKVTKTGKKWLYRKPSELAMATRKMQEEERQKQTAA
jgi:hypothetical protein